ncbi:hypothetical protein NKR23_g2377 [Pleurostoma richardsiae]|uniref:WW domain-containing protein n=1 Tax=Pleurostoma richardsiae TaxID=41990 RepID=A0AA38SAJ9_9PEZI|nr:hypothetical protein NKR23_g2377 [Pleurostoma richardsiae]
MAPGASGDKEPEQVIVSPASARDGSEEGEARSSTSGPKESPAGSSPKKPASESRSPNSKPDAGEKSQSPVAGKAEGAAEDAPPLPDEPAPESVDDGWSCEWDVTRGAWYFFNRFTGVSQWDNPRVAGATAPGTAAAAATAPGSAVAVGGYNPAIHGDWDPNASYAQAYAGEDSLDGPEGPLPDASVLQVPGAFFNKRTGQFQRPDQTDERHTDEAKSKRQMDAYFDVDRAANSHDGRSLKAERQGKKPTKKELSAWKEKRKARKEEKRRAWLRD